MGDAAKGGKLEDIADFYKKQGETGIEYTVRNLDESNYRSDTMTYPLLMAALNNLQIDQVSRVIDENGSFAIAKVLNKSADSYSSLDEAIEQIKKDLADKKYVEYIDKLVQAAKIVINDNVYKSMS
jgi:parvulin-like peptidyl-prolyl isomerase